MVAGFQDDVDIEDQPHGQSLLPSDPIPSKNISLSSEEEAEGLTGHPRVAPQQCSEPETKWYGLGFPEYGQLRWWQPRVASAPDISSYMKVLHQGLTSTKEGSPHARHTTVVRWS